MNYSLSAEHSLDLWTGNTQTPSQLIVIAGKGGTSTVQLPNRTSLLIYADKKNLPKPTELRQGVQVMPLALALVRGSPGFFRHSATSAEIALRPGDTEVIGSNLDSAETARLLDDPAAYEAMSQATNPFGDGKSAQRIADILEQQFRPGTRLHASSADSAR